MEVASRDRAAPFTTMDGSTIRMLLDAGLGDAVNQSLAEAALDPGQATERHYHPRTEEIYVVLAGSAEMEVDGECREVGPGDAVLIPPGARHRIRNRGEGELRFLCCCAPPYSDGDTVFD